MNAFAVRCISILLAFGVANALGSSNTFFGDFRYSLNSLDVGDSSTQGENNASRIGFKGEFGQTDALTAFYHLQVGVNVDGAGDAFSQRFYLAGLKGNFGSLVYGRTSTAYKMAGLRIDPFYDSSAGTGFGGSNFGLSPLTNGWTDNSLLYTTPTFTNFSFNAGSYGRVDNVSATADGDGYSIGAFYKLPTKTVLSLIYSTIDFDSGSDRKVLSLGISQKFSFTIK